MEKRTGGDDGLGKPQQELLAKKLIETMETAIDTRIGELDSLNHSELEKLRNDRISSMKEEARKTKELLSNGHGEYDEVEELTFFKVSTNSDKVIVHFYTGNSPTCDMFDMYLKALAKTHLESRFVRLNAEKSPFLVGRLNITHFPTIIIIINGMTADRIAALAGLDGCDTFSRDALEWRLSLHGGINYDGDYDPLSHLKTKRTEIRKIYKKKTIREDDDTSSD